MLKIESSVCADSATAAARFNRRQTIEATETCPRRKEQFAFTQRLYDQTQKQQVILSTPPIDQADPAVSCLTPDVRIFAPPSVSYLSANQKYPKFLPAKPLRTTSRLSSSPLYPPASTPSFPAGFVVIEKSHDAILTACQPRNGTFPVLSNVRGQTPIAKHEPRRRA